MPTSRAGFFIPVEAAPVVFKWMELRGHVVTFATQRDGLGLGTSYTTDSEERGWSEITLNVIEFVKNSYDWSQEEENIWIRTNPNLPEV